MENGKQISLYVDGNKMKHSIHGDLFACVDCHKDVKGLVHETTPRKVRCAECHADAQEAYTHSLHAKAYRQAGRGQTARTATEARTKFWPPPMQNRRSIMTTSPPPAAGVTGRSF